MIFRFEDYQVAVWIGPPFCVRMGLLAGKKSESRDLASYIGEDGLRVVRACVGESKLSECGTGDGREGFVTVVMGM
jgi:hypothetical protein